MRPVPEREAAKAIGERFYFTGKPCKNGHLSKRYTGTGICAVCAVKNTLAHQKKQPWHPARITAREIGKRHFSIGKPCIHGHTDKRFVSNGICVQCSIDRCARWLKARPGYEATAARQRRAKDPRGHRAEAKRWAQNNKRAVKEALKRWKAANPERVREIGRIATSRRRTRQTGNGGFFTAADIAAIYQRQQGRCAACPSINDLEIDHILPVVLGGTSNPSNLQLLCLPCNRSKGGKHPDKWKGRTITCAT